MKIAAIVNPCSAGGRAARLWPEIKTLLENRLGRVDARLTAAPLDAISISRELVRTGCDLIIAVGGDGTVNEVVNGFFDGPEAVMSPSPKTAGEDTGAKSNSVEHSSMPQPALGIIPVGTGGDFRRSLGIPSDPKEAVEILATGTRVEIDVGKATCRNHAGDPETRYFVNLLSFGMGGRVAARSHNVLARISGKTAFAWATLETFIRFRGREVTLRLDSGEEISRVIANVAVGNGQYHGGGMRPCPDAELTDGMFEITLVDYAGAFELIRSMPLLYSGQIYTHPSVRHFRARKLCARADKITEIEIDGESLGTLPLEISLLPRGLSVISGCGAGRQ